MQATDSVSTLGSGQSGPGTRFDVCAVGVLVAATLTMRMLTLPAIDMGGDAAYKWFFVRSLPFANPWRYDHHTARFAVIIPIYIVQRLFGTHPNAMYIAPMIMATLQVPLIYAIARETSARWVGILGCLALLLFRPMIDTAGQLLPGVFQATYVLGAFYMYVRFARSAPHDRRFLLGIAALLFCGYLSMVTTLYFIPGFVVAVYAVRRNLRDAAFLCAAFLGLLALETGLYALLSPYKWGQLQIILATHTDVPPTTFFGLFARYEVLPRDWRYALGLAALACAVVLPSKRPALRGLALVFLSFLAGSTFGIKHLNPIVPALRFFTRYFDAITPFVVLLLGTACWLCTSRWWPNLRPARLLALLIVLSLAVVAGAVRMYRGRPPHALARNARDYQILNDGYARGLPIIATNRRYHDQIKTLFVIRWAYLAEELLRVGNVLTLGDLPQARSAGHSYRYIARQPLKPDSVGNALKQQHCCVTATRQKGAEKLVVEAYPANDSCSDLRTP